MSKRFFFRWKKEWTEFAILVFTLRFIYAFFGLSIISNGGVIPLDEKVYALIQPLLATDKFSQLYVNTWFQWDTISYLRIAILGYGPDDSIAFMPLYPLLIRVAAHVFSGNYLLAALILSTIFCLISLILLYELFAGYYSGKVARLTVFLFMVFPTSFFLLAGYTESLFLMLVLIFWILAKRQHWLWASFFASLAALTRLQGVILSIIMIWMLLVSFVNQPQLNFRMQLQQILGLFKSWRQNFGGRRILWLISALTPIVVVAGYQAWLYSSGLGVISEALEKYWRIKTVMPWTGFLLFVQRIFTAHFSYMDWIDLFLFIVVLIAAVVGLYVLDSAFSLYVWLTIAVLLTRGTPPHLLASYSRYFVALFPLFVLPVLIKSRILRAAIFIFFILFHFLLAWIFLWGSWVA